MEHNTGMDAFDDVILVGHYVDNDDVDFTAYKMKMPKDFLNDTFDVVEVNPNVYVTNAQLTSPFVHSTASWSRDHNCDKDISKLKPPQKLYMEDKGEGVNVHIRRSETAYNYLLKSIDRQPYVRFSLSGKLSFYPGKIILIAVKNLIGNKLIFGKIRLRYRLVCDLSVTSS